MHVHALAWLEAELGALANVVADLPLGQDANNPSAVEHGNGGTVVVHHRDLMDLPLLHGLQRFQQRSL